MPVDMMRYAAAFFSMFIFLLTSLLQASYLEISFFVNQPIFTYPYSTQYNSSLTVCTYLPTILNKVLKLSYTQN